jgi:hypothetical protein
MREPEMIEYDLTSIPNSDEICWEYLPDGDPSILSDEGWEQTEGGIFIRMSPITMGVIASSEYVRLKTISSGNILEWIYRLDCLFDAGQTTLAVSTLEGDIPIRFRPPDLKKHIGLKISTPVWSKEKFDAYIRQLRMHRHLSGEDFEV